MPFSHVAQEYQPEQLKNLTQAFDLAWPKVVQACRVRNEDQAICLRERVANYILACAAAQCEFDPEKLSQSAIRAFCKPDIEQEPVITVPGLPEARVTLAAGTSASLPQQP
jgi:hypothetical protein